MSYLIEINDEQRLMLIQALKVLRNIPDQLAALKPSPIFPETIEEEVHYFLTNLEELPEVERNNPGILHGFCL
jgi:hypothetical protein